MIESVIIGDQAGIPIVAQRRKLGGVSLSAGRNLITLSPAELFNLLTFANGGTAVSPAKARWSDSEISIK